MAHVGSAVASQVDVHTNSKISWGAIIGGWMVAAGIAFLMYVAGLAVGFAAFDPYNAAATAKGIGIGTALWIVLTSAVSVFLGGMFASWFDGKADQTVGALHGITVWGLSVTVSALLGALGLTQVVQGGAAIMRGAATVGAAGGPVKGAADDAITGLQAQLTQRVAQTSARAQPSTPAPGTEQARGTMAAVAGALMKGNTENAKALLAANTSMSQSEIDQTLQGVAAQVDKHKADVQAAADRAARYTAAAMLIVFFSGLLALVASAVGGWLGAGHIHRVYHLRRFETAGPL